MKKTVKFALGAGLAGSLALAAMLPAEAAVHVGIGFGIPVAAPAPRWCYRHPGACRPAPAVGVFVPGRGWWDGHRWFWHRYRWHGGWRYR